MQKYRYRRLFTVALALGSVIGFGTVASAQSSDTAKSDCARIRAQGKRCKFIPIEPDDIKGGVVKSAYKRYSVPTRAEHTSLIRLRLDFQDKIVKTAEQL